MGVIKKMSGHISELFKKGTAPKRLCEGLLCFLDAPADQYTNNHNFDTFISKASKWMNKADDEKYDIEWEDKPCDAPMVTTAISGSR